MRTNWLLSLSLVSLTLTVLALGAPSTSSTQSPAVVGPAPLSTSTTSSAFDGPFITGSIDIRPSYYPDAADSNGVDGIGTQNSVELGVQLSPKVGMAYNQSFNTNVYQANGGKDVVAQDGFLRTKVANIWNSPDETWSLGFENRLYVPTKSSARENGMVTVVRNYLNLTKKFSETLSVTASLVPIVHLYNRAGNGAGVDAAANPAFENRIYLIPTITLAPRLTLSLPIFFHQSLSRVYLGKSKWTFDLWTWPELMYGLTENQSIGVAYVSDPLSTGNDDGALKPTGGGAFQLVFQATL